MTTNWPKLRLGLVVGLAAGLAALVIWDLGRPGPEAVPTATVPQVETGKTPARGQATSKAPSREREPARASVSVSQADM